jgi:GNAT superfamily N-acetyltransferase
MEPVLTRPAVPGDIEPLLALARRFATSFRVDDGSFRATFTRVVASEGDHLIVAEREGHAVGYLLGFTRPAFWANGPIGWVEEIMVSEEHRRQGIGRALMAAFEERAAQRGARVVALATRRAGPFYEALGYADSAHYFKKGLS